MYLKRLELQGFKSFADKTVLDFGQGVTTVVGPNGSGKSNISDAIRWVMGEMSAKTLRGSNMQDVIFAGTETRKKVNFAEVSLVLDNSDKMFPIEFDEIVVTRKVFRSGETVYQINHADCRLKDIHELFMDTGLGRDGYSMIGQGNVSQILSTKAEDRRSFFEEAAGVSKYKHRKDEALRKLVAVNENLVRINDIANELEGRLGPLEAQSKKARKYMVLYDEYKGLDVSMSLYYLEKNAETLKKAQEIYNSVLDEINELKEKETDIERKRDELYIKSSAKDEELSAKNNELVENEAKCNARGNDISIAENDIKNSRSLIERLDKEISSTDSGIEISNRRIKELEESIAQREEEKKSLMNGFEEIQKRNSEIYERINQYKSELDKLKAKQLEKLNDQSEAKAQTEGSEKFRQSLMERKASLEEELKNRGAGVAAIKQRIEETKTLSDEKREKSAKMRERTDKLREKLTSLNSEYESARRELSQRQVSLNSKASQKKILEGMENDYEGFSRSVKAVMTAPQLKKSAIYGTVSGLIDVDKKYVTAIEIALGGAMQNIVVESEEDAKAAISFLKQNKSGRATFLPISAVSVRNLENANEVSKQNGFVGIASSIIRYDKKYDTVMKSLLGRVVITDTMDNAVAMARKFSYRFKIVTLEGELLNAGGSISGGSVNKTSGFLSRSAQIKTLGEEISALNNEISELSGKLKSSEESIKSTNAQLSDYMPMLREYENEILVADNTIEHLKKSLSDSDTSEKNLAGELAELDKRLSGSADEVAKQISAARRLENELDEINKQIAESESNFDSLTSEKDEKAKELMDETLRLRTLEKDIENDRQTIADMKSSIDDRKKQRLSRCEERQSMFLKIAELEEVIEEKNRLIGEIKQNSEKIKGEIEKIENEKQSIVEGLKSITDNNKSLTDRMMVLQQELSKAEAKQVKTEENTEAIVNRLWDEYELSRSQAEDIRLDIENFDEAKQRTAELKGKIKALGSVNVDSIDEYVSTKERYDFLTGQKKDLETSEDNLNKVINSMQELMEEHFQKQFAEINKAFSRVFAELFGGGQGRLSLSDPANVMESGIEIDVQLPGKGLQNINLYSGGEKSFIAIALLFAILEVKPTPFCFLDEIDAALDDVNVSRFATYLKNYLNATQFIVITHRRGTMEAANIMYGVTMQEKGVSKLLSLMIDDVDNSMVN